MSAAVATPAPANENEPIASEVLRQSRLHLSPLLVCAVLLVLLCPSLLFLGRSLLLGPHSLHFALSPFSLSSFPYCPPDLIAQVFFHASVFVPCKHNFPWQIVAFLGRPGQHGCRGRWSEETSQVWRSTASKVAVCAAAGHFAMSRGEAPSPQGVQEEGRCMWWRFCVDGS